MKHNKIKFNCLRHSFVRKNCQPEGIAFLPQRTTTTCYFCSEMKFPIHVRTPFTWKLEGVFRRTALSPLRDIPQPLVVVPGYCDESVYSRGMLENTTTLRIVFGAKRFGGSPHHRKEELKSLAVGSSQPGQNSPRTTCVAKSS